MFKFITSPVNFLDSCAEVFQLWWTCLRFKSMRTHLAPSTSESSQCVTLSLVPELLFPVAWSKPAARSGTSFYFPMPDVTESRDEFIMEMFWCFLVCQKISFSLQHAFFFFSHELKRRLLPEAAPRLLVIYSVKTKRKQLFLTRMICIHLSVFTLSVCILFFWFHILPDR